MRYIATGNDCRTFITYLAPVLLDGLVSVGELENARQLSAIVAISSSRPAAADLMRLYDLIDQFLSGCALLYGKQVITINFHQLVHLPAYIRLYGATYNYSLFTFESDNGVLQRLLTGTVGQAKQAAERFLMHCSLPRIARTLPPADAKWFTQMSGRQTTFALEESRRTVKGVGPSKPPGAFPAQSCKDLDSCRASHNVGIVEYERVGFGRHVFWTTNYRYATAGRLCDFARLRRPTVRGVGATSYIQILHCYFCTTCENIFLHVQVLQSVPNSLGPARHIVECKTAAE